MSVTEKLQSPDRKSNFVKRSNPVLPFRDRFAAAEANPDFVPPSGSAPTLVHSASEQDAASMSVPARASRPINRVEKTIGFEAELYQFIQHAALTEALRLGRPVPVSEIVRAMVVFARTHIKDNHIIPTEDGLGLHVEER